ncbi:MAG: phage tail assembly chaperone [Pseudomonas sp.]|nr:phage tail assembly chaperone [Pseudomonas sp.]
MTALKILSVSATDRTMLIDWGSVTLNHFIPQEVLDHPEIDASALVQIIETMRPAIPVAIELPQALQAMVEPVADGDEERAWRDAELITWVAVRDRHRDELELGIATTLTAAQFAELLVYIQLLRDWPQSAEFPDIEHRPVTPTWLVEP